MFLKKLPKFRKKNIIGNVNKKYLKNGSYSMGVTAIGIAIIVVGNLILAEIPEKYTKLDVSSQQLYTIGEETKSALKNLEKDVVIYQIAQDGAEDENISTLLSRYEDETKHIQVERKDPVMNPNFVLQYTTDNISSNSLIVVCGERSKIIDYSNLYESELDYNTYSYQTTGFDGEGQITSAIGYVTSENLPVLYTLEGHGEVELDSSMKEAIEKANMEIRTLNLITQGSIPEDASCLMIASPTSDISAEEKDAIITYLENGGEAMIFSDYVNVDMPNFDMVLENYGIERAQGIVFEGDNQYYAMQTPYYLVPEIHSTDASTESANGSFYVLAPYAQGIMRMDDVRDTVNINSILTTSESSYSKTNLNSEVFEKEETDVEGPFDLGVCITEEIDTDKETKIIYYSTANLLQSQINQMVSGGNQKLLMESLSWLSGSEEGNNSVSIPSKSLQVSYLTLTAYDAAFWKICVTGLIPGAFLVLGFMIWLKRRKA